ncbi:MAG: hypothetical protein QOK42_271, partial [Frankiaceae bacterium]|nr:hypothetical protein [Frankiaceae bacterium]
MRLWELDQSLFALDAHRGDLLAERGRLLAALRPGTVLAAPLTPPVPFGPIPVWPSPVPLPRQEWTPQRIQNTLLALGALLLTIAGIVFAAVTYDRLGAGGRAAVLIALTALAGGAVPRL